MTWTTSSGSGDITDVYNCASGDCNNIVLADGDLLNMSSVSVSATTEGLILPQHATDCSTAGTAEGQVCWEADANTLYVGDGATVKALILVQSMNLPIYSAKLTGGFVVRTPTSGDASTQGAQIDAGDGNWRLLFDPTTYEAAVWQFRLPDYWTGHSELNVFYTMTSATAAEVEFEADVMCVTDGDAADVGTAGFVGVAVGSATVPGTAGYPD